MIKITLCLFFIGHILGNFYFQSSYTFHRKDKAFDKDFINSVIYFFAMLLAILPILSLSSLSWIILISFIHFSIDWLKSYLDKNYKFTSLGETRILFLDQAIHIIMILLVTMLIYINPTTIEFNTMFKYLIETFSINMELVVSWALAVLLLVKPFSIIISKVLSKYQPKTIAIEELGHPGAGALIGVLERLIILLMLSQNQYVAIGFVLTAKSIARYNKIIEDPQFSEYYLLGTLLSMLLVIITHMILFR